MTNSRTARIETPAECGCVMPAEWERHEATWLAWPHNINDWPGKFALIPWVYGEMVRKISAGEIVRILVRNRIEEKRARSILKSSGCDLKSIEFIVHPTNRSWVRDSGPIFVKQGRAGSLRPAGQRVVRSSGFRRSLNRLEAELQTETAIVHFHFNGWARYGDWQKDTMIPDIAAKLLRKELFHAKYCTAISIRNPQSAIRNFTIEGGGIEVNGHGTLITTEECYLHPRIQVRNPGMTRSEYEGLFGKYLGVRNVFWLPNGTEGDDTHGHIDDVCRFVSRKTLVLIRETHPRDVNYRRLAQNWERIRDLRLEDGSKPEVVPLPMPAPLYFNGMRLPASYANFYIANDCVIVPTFNDPNDRVALGTLGELFKDRTVTGIHALDLVLGSGSLHCLTQQQPA